MGTTQIEKFIWDLTYACPLRCKHCYSESGRRAARMLQHDDAMRVVDVIISARPKRISLSGGEPLLVPWWNEAAKRLHAAGIVVTIFTSGWLMDEQVAHDLADSVTSVAVSVDGTGDQVHDTIRGRAGSFAKAMNALGVLETVKRERAASGERCYTLGVDYTMTRSGMESLEQFVEDITTSFPDLDFIRFGAVIPSGLAAEEDFAECELLTYTDLVEIADSRQRLESKARNKTEVAVTDVRYFLPDTSVSAASEGIASIEADGQMRAFPIYEAKIGNVLEEPLELLWRRVLEWRQDPFVLEQVRSVKSVADWARVTRILDRRYGSEADKVRIARRGKA